MYNILKYFAFALIMGAFAMQLRDTMKKPTAKEYLVLVLEVTTAALILTL